MYTDEEVWRAGQRSEVGSHFQREAAVEAGRLQDLYHATPSLIIIICQTIIHYLDLGTSEYSASRCVTAWHMSLLRRRLMKGNYLFRIKTQHTHFITKINNTLRL